MQGNFLSINFCQWCGGAMKHEIPDGEEKMRAICTLCGKIAYQNPKMVCEEDVLLLPNYAEVFCYLCWISHVGANLWATFLCSIVICF